MNAPDDQTVTAPRPEPDDGTTRAQPSAPAHLFHEAALPDVPGYSVVREIARGGMAAVYRAHDATFDRDVAVKVMHAGQDATRFVVESKVTARVAHPGIPPVYALGELPDGRPFLAMKLVEGGTLSDERKSAGPTDLPRLLSAFERVCDTVGFAHARGIVHRDLKPANVMVGAFGEVLVMDWGLAKDVGPRVVGSLPSVDSPFEREIAQGADAPHTGTETVVGAIKGTPAYMAPEQARGEPVDARADVFALGAILAVILTGHPPFRGETVHDTVKRAAKADLAEHFARLDACGADAELIALAKRCLAPAAADRFADGKAVAEAAAAYRAGVEERLRQSERDRAVSAAEAREQRKRRKVKLALAGAVGLLLAAAGAFAWHSDRQRMEAAAKAARNRDGVAGLIEQTEAALRAGDADRAGEALAQAESRAAEGGADDLAPRLERCRGELAALRELDAVLADRFTASSQFRLPKWPELAPRLARVFAALGVTPGVTPPDEVARIVADAHIRESLLAYLEVWGAAGDGGPVVRDLLGRVDPHPFRDAARATDYARAAIAWGLRGAPVPAAPVWFAFGHGENPHLPTAGREQILLAGLRDRPNSYALLMSLAVLDLDDKPSSARRVGACRAALAVRPKSVTAWIVLAMALRAGGDLPGSLGAYEKVLELAPHSAAAHNNLGNVRDALGDLPGALACFDRALALDSNYPQAHTNRGATLMALGRLPEAVEAHRRAIALDGSYFAAHHNLGLVLIRMRDWSNAVASCRRATELAPDHAGAFNNLGVALRHSGAPRAARTAYLKAIDLGGKDAVNCENVATTHLDERDYPEAVRWARDAVALDRRRASAHGTLGLALRQTGDIPGARAALTEAARLDNRWAFQLARVPPVPLAPAPREINP